MIYLKVILSAYAYANLLMITILDLAAHNCFTSTEDLDHHDEEQGIALDVFFLALTIKWFLYYSVDFSSKGFNLINHVVSIFVISELFVYNALSFELSTCDFHKHGSHRIQLTKYGFMCTNNNR